MCAGIKLLFLPLRCRRLPNSELFRQSSDPSNFKFFVLHNRLFHSARFVTLGRFICGFLCPFWMVSGSASIKSRGKNFYGQAKAFEIPEVHHSYRFRYSTADACDELHRNGRSVFSVNTFVHRAFWRVPYLCPSGIPPYDLHLAGCFLLNALF